METVRKITAVPRISPGAVSPVRVRCPFCDWRLLDKVSATTGTIELKCPQCRKIVRIDLSFRRRIRFR